MKPTHQFAIVIAILCSAGLCQAAVTDLTEIVPEGAPMVTYVGDVQASMDNWGSSPMGQLWNDPQVKAFFAPLWDELEINRWDDVVRSETGHGIDEIKAMFTGDLVVFVENFEVFLEEGAEDIDVEMVMAIAVGDNASEVERMILEQEQKAADDAIDEPREDGSETKYETREFRGVKLHIEETFEGDDLTLSSGWAVVEGVWATATPVENLERAVSAILDGGLESTVASGTNFSTVSKHIRSADSWFYMDIDPWMPAARALADEGLKAAAEAGSPFPVDPAALVDSLGIEAMQAFFATLEFDGGTMLMDFGATYTEDEGLIKLFAYGPGEAPRVTYIPVDSDTFSTSAYDFAGAWSALVGIVNGINPALMGFASMQLESSLQEAGIDLDLKRDLLDNLTGEMATVQNMGGITGASVLDANLEQDQVIILGIQQREALETVIEGIKTLVGQGSDFFSQREFENHTIFTLDVPQAEGETPGEKIAYVVTDEHLLISIGSSATLEKVLLKMESNGTSVWKQTKVRRAVGLLPDGATSIQYQDVASFGDLFFAGIALVDSFDATEDGEDGRFCDPKAIPDSDTLGKYIESVVGGAWKDDRELLIRVYVLPADEK
jgi:hypothetical protein